MSLLRINGTGTLFFENWAFLLELGLYADFCSFICYCRSWIGILLSLREDTTCWRAWWVIGSPPPGPFRYSLFSIHSLDFFTEEKERGLKSYGRPQIGGPFSLTTHDNKPFTQENLLGKWSLVYFGFTNCPDICPAELDKVTAVLDNIRTPSSSIIEAFETNMSNRERARRYISTRLHFRRPSSRYSIPYRSIPERFPRFLHRPRWRIRRY